MFLYTSLLGKLEKRYSLKACRLQTALSTDSDKKNNLQKMPVTLIQVSVGYFVFLLTPSPLYRGDVLF